jgi:two-component system, NarL family, response regulator LiaR
VIRVLIVDDHKLVRQGLRFLLEQEPDVQVVGERGDGSELAETANRLRPDVVLLDLIMPGVDGVTALRELKKSMPSAHVVVLTSHRGDDRVREAIAAGADCYLLKTAGVEDVLGTIRAAAAGRSVLDAEIAARILRPARPARSSAVDELSRREVEVLVALARGRSNKEIAADLEIGEQTVKTHVSNILDKLRLQDRTQAAVFALRQRLVPLDE